MSGLVSDWLQSGLRFNGLKGLLITDCHERRVKHRVRARSYDVEILVAADGLCSNELMSLPGLGVLG